MKKRTRLENKDEEKEKNSYFTSKKKNLKFVSTGCKVLDCSIGGGYVLGRMANVIGDKSTAKTALATEALINFKQAYPEGKAAYRETEAAYDYEYASEMGLPVDEIDFGDEENPVDTVEKFYNDLKTFIDQCQANEAPGIYVLDSFDALSDEEEMKREIDKGSYQMNKQKQIGVLFRKLTKRLEKSKVALIIISQVRENIGISFGEKYRRSGGKALDFYATQCLWLAHVKTLKRTVKKIERAYGISIKAKCKKNKIGFPFREADFDFIFGFGVDDIGASINFLKSSGRLDEINVKDTKVKEYLSNIENLDDKQYRKERSKLSKAVVKVWNEIETNFLPKRRKY